MQEARNLTKAERLATCLSLIFNFQIDRLCYLQAASLKIFTFSHLAELHYFPHSILFHALHWSPCCIIFDRCSVFLLEKETNELVAKVFDGDVRSCKEVRIFDVRTWFCTFFKLFLITLHSNAVYMLSGSLFGVSLSFGWVISLSYCRNLSSGSWLSM